MFTIACIYNPINSNLAYIRSSDTSVACEELRVYLCSSEQTK